MWASKGRTLSMKATLSFNLPEEQEEFNLATKASNFSHCLWAFDTEFLRANIKHGIQSTTVDSVMEELKEFFDDPTTKEHSKEDVARIAEATLEHVRTVLYQYMNANDANPFQ